MARFEQAPAEAGRIESQLARAQTIIAGLPEASRAEAQEVLEQAQASYSAFQAKLSSKDTGFYVGQQQATRDANRAVS